MALEHPPLIPPDDLRLDRTDGGTPVTLHRCRLLAHNVAADGKADPIDDEPHFEFVYQYGDLFFRVSGLNPEMMSGHQISASDASDLLARMPYRVEQVP